MGNWVVTLAASPRSIWQDFCLAIQFDADLAALVADAGSGAAQGWQMTTAKYPDHWLYLEALAIIAAHAAALCAAFL